MSNFEIIPKDAVSLKNAIFVDIRENVERSGVYIEESIHIPLNKILSGLNQLPRKKDIVVYCSTGCRSFEAANILKENGFERVFILKGGVKAWQKDGLPVIHGPFERYMRQIILPQIGLSGQDKILSSRVLIVGAGGLGSPTALYLAGAGVGTIGIADYDNVSRDNLQRQIVHRDKDVGTPKAESAVRTIRAFNPDINVVAIKGAVEEKNCESILKDYDVIVDGTDNFPARYLLNKACAKAGIPLVHGSVLRFYGQVSVFHPKKGGPCYACVYPEPPPPEIAPSCADAGIIGVVPGVIGSMQALEALKLIAGFGEPLIGKLLIFDGLACKMRVLEVKRDLKCRVCNVC